MRRRLVVQSVDIYYTNKLQLHCRLLPKVQMLLGVNMMVLSINNSNQLNIYPDYRIPILHTSYLERLLKYEQM